MKVWVVMSRADYVDETITKIEVVFTTREAAIKAIETEFNRDSVEYTQTDYGFESPTVRLFITSREVQA